MTSYKLIASPVGDITLAANDTHLIALHISGDRYFTAPPSNWHNQPDHPVLTAASRQLQAYFDGKQSKFDVPIVSVGTPFQRAVWEALREIPAGQTASYSEIAQRIGRPNAVRAVGTAVGRNPICIIIPCHRVLASNGGFGGYVAGTDCKQFLLELEKRPSILLF